MRDMCNRQNCNGQIFIVFLFIAINYWSIAYLFLICLKPFYWIISLIIFHISFIMMLWSMIKSIVSDPGRVPIYWGFFLEPQQSKKKRYCLICHSFKPERCHHCSTCQRCVLNMDHHCPWISNCVGFMNRKFFILFLTYIILTLAISLLSIIYPLVQQIILMFQDFQKAGALSIIRIIGSILQIAFLILFSFFITILIFYKFHITLVLTNSTTIDNLDKERNPNVHRKNIYQLQTLQNFYQVFGKNPCLWPLPMYGQTGKPVGTGVSWQKNSSVQE